MIDSIVNAADGVCVRVAVGLYCFNSLPGRGISGGFMHVVVILFFYELV